MRHPEVMARARADDAYLDATIKEVLRIRPVVLDVARVVAAPARVAGYDLEPGTMVVPAITPVHRAGEVWPDPERFDPERFLERLARALLVDPLRRRGAPLPRRRVRRSWR